MVGHVQVKTGQEEVKTWSKTSSSEFCLKVSKKKWQKLKGRSGGFEKMRTLQNVLQSLSFNGGEIKTQERRGNY